MNRQETGTARLSSEIWLSQVSRGRVKQGMMDAFATGLGIRVTAEIDMVAVSRESRRSQNHSDERSESEFHKILVCA
jgi:hypothetical protein